MPTGLDNDFEPKRDVDKVDYTPDERKRIERILEHMSDQGGLVDAQTSRLTSAIRVSAIKSEVGAEFSIDEETMERDTELARCIFKDPNFLKQMAEIGIEGSDDEEGEGDSVASTFERKRRGMQDAFPDDQQRRGLLHKRVRAFGCGSRPPPGALVTFHYSLYKETGDTSIYPEPFDSTRMHWDAKPYNKRLGTDLIPGIDWALSTMCKGERANFLIQPEAFLGDKGALDRIPGGVPILADLELINFCDSASVDAFYSMDEEERRSVPFKVQLGVVQSLRHAANELYFKKLYTHALQKYRGAEAVLTTINIASDDEENRMKKELCVLGVNKANTLYRLGRFPSVVRECNEVLKRDPRSIKIRVKALFWRGEALCSMGHHEEAAASLAECQKLTGRLSSVSRARIEEAVQRNNDEMRKYLEDQRRFYKKMGSCFAAAAGTAAPAPPAGNSKEALDEELRAKMRRQLEKFLADPDQRIMSYTTVNVDAAEARCMLATAAEFPRLLVKETPALITITKKSRVFE